MSFTNCILLSTDYNRGSARDDVETPLMSPGSLSSRPFSLDDETIALLNKDNKFIAKDHLTLGDYVGKGHFGYVNKVKLYYPAREETDTVAVKTLCSLWDRSSTLHFLVAQSQIHTLICLPHIFWQVKYSSVFACESSGNAVEGGGERFTHC